MILCSAQGIPRQMRCSPSDTHCLSAEAYLNPATYFIIVLFVNIPFIMKFFITLLLKNRVISKTHTARTPYLSRTYFFASFGLFAPYLERACLLLATPAVSSVPLMMWYLVPGRSFTLPPRIITTLCSCRLCPSPGM